uniref:Uncharacterized protein n=1 Tax=Arundo donax TaxID=35708 RepID=A0A0A9EHU5_ARUDO
MIKGKMDWNLPSLSSLTCSGSNAKSPGSACSSLGSSSTTRRTRKQNEPYNFFSVLVYKIITKRKNMKFEE